MQQVAVQTPTSVEKPSKATETLKVTGKNRAAIDLMVWEGLKRADAAQKAGLKDHALYVALTKPHVKAYYMAQLDVLRTSERARNIHALVDVRDSKTNQMATVAAVKALEQLSDSPTAGVTASQSPGVVIQILTTNAQPALMAHERHIDANSLITIGSVQDGD